MPAPIRAVRTALVIVAAASVLGGISSSAGAQRSPPRSGVAVDPDAARHKPPHPVAPSDPGFTGRRQMPLYPVGSNTGNPAVVYVMPGYGYPYPRGAYGVGGTIGGAYDTNGRPLSTGQETGPSYDAVPSYTPDLSGSPYVVIEGGAMMVDLASGERRAFPACAATSASHDPDGRPRTIFYDGSANGVVLREGQRGRVQGSPAGASCYGVDGLGRIALLG